MKKLSFLILVSALAVACTSIDCPLEHTVISRYAMLTPDQKTDTLRDTLTVSIVRKRAANPDTALLNKAIGLTTFQIPISYTNAVDTLYFQFRNQPYAETDTVWLTKQNIPHFESVDCTASFFHEITAVRCTHHAIDSIRINNPMVDYDSQTAHFHLYLKNRR